MSNLLSNKDASTPTLTVLLFSQVIFILGNLLGLIPRASLFPNRYPLPAPSNKNRSCHNLWSTLSSPVIPTLAFTFRKLINETLFLKKFSLLTTQPKPTHTKGLPPGTTQLKNTAASGDGCQTRKRQPKKHVHAITRTETARTKTKPTQVF